MATKQKASKAPTPAPAPTGSKPLKPQEHPSVPNKGTTRTDS